jgi:phenylacetate-CoA ligase
LQIEGAPASVAFDAIAVRFKQQTLISADVIEAVAKLEGAHLVTDQRSTA